MGSVNRSAIPAASEAIEAVRRAAARLAREEIPTFLGELERVRAEILIAANTPVQEPASAVAEPSGLLTAERVAARLGCSKWWVYKNRDSLPIVRLPTGGYRFKAEALETWIRRRSG